MNKLVGQKGRKERKYGKESRHCVRCGTYHALIIRYVLNICRQCFRGVSRSS